MLTPDQISVFAAAMGGAFIGAMLGIYSGLRISMSLIKEAFKD